MDVASVVWPLLLAVSDQVWLALITLGTGIVTVAGATLTGWIAFRQKMLDKKLDHQQNTLDGQDRKLDNVAIVAQATYTFQNHAMGLQKKALAIACRSKAEITNTAADKKEADNAENDYLEHQRGQAKVDAQALITRAEEQARKVLQESASEHPQEAVAAAVEAKEIPAVEIPEAKASEHMKAKPQIEKDTATVIQALAGEISKTHDIKGTVELTPKEPEKGGV